MLRMLRAMTIAFAAALSAFAANDVAHGQQAVAPAEVVKEFAPTGKLRAAINVGNVLYAQKDPKSGELRGITPDLARALA